MTKTNRKNHTIKAFQTMLSIEEKKYKNTDGAYIRVERQMIGSASNRGDGLTCERVKDYCNRYLQVIGYGLSKVAYGMRDIVICFNKPNFTNQVKNQVDFWNKIALTADADYFNPVLSYGLHRGDKLYKNDNRYIDKSFIVSQKAELFPTIDECIKQMFIYNQAAFNGRDVANYKRKLEAVAKRYDIRDILNGNIGLIYDYSKGEYKTVFIDYAL